MWPTIACRPASVIHTRATPIVFSPRRRDQARRLASPARSPITHGSAFGGAGDGCYRLEQGLLKVVITSPRGDNRTAVPPEIEASAAIWWRFRQSRFPWLLAPTSKLAP